MGNTVPSQKSVQESVVNVMTSIISDSLQQATLQSDFSQSVEVNCEGFITQEQNQLITDCRERQAANKVFDAATLTAICGPFATCGGSQITLRSGVTTDLSANQMNLANASVTNAMSTKLKTELEKENSILFDDKQSSNVKSLATAATEFFVENNQDVLVKATGAQTVTIKDAQVDFVSLISVQDVFATALQENEQVATAITTVTVDIQDIQKQSSGVLDVVWTVMGVCLGLVLLVALVLGLIKFIRG